MPAVTRDSFFAVRAFNAELASIKDSHNIRHHRGTSPPDQVVSASTVPTTLALQLRMQWWRSAIEEIYNNERTTNEKIPNHDRDPWLAANLSISCWHSPVVRALDRAHSKSNFTRRFLERLIDAREYDLEIRQYNTMDEAVTYAEETVGSLLYLTLETTGVRDNAADAVASHAGIGIGLATALRATPYRLLHGGEVPLPADLFRPGFPYERLVPMFLGDPDDRDRMIVLTDSDAQILRDAVQHMANTATEHLIGAQRLQRQVLSAGRACLLPVIPALTYLSKLEQANYNVFDTNVTSGTSSDRLKLLFRLGRSWMTGIF